MAIRQVFAKRAVSFCLIFNPFPPTPPALKKKFADKCRLKKAALGSVSGQKEPKLPKILYFLKIIIAGAIISFFASKGNDHSREAIISNIAHWKSYPKYLVLLSH